MAHSSSSLGPTRVGFSLPAHRLVGNLYGASAGDADIDNALLIVLRSEATPRRVHPRVFSAAENTGQGRHRVDGLELWLPSHEAVPRSQPPQPENGKVQIF